MRERRTRLGELVQADGSPYWWLEDRGDLSPLHRLRKGVRITIGMIRTGE